MIGLPEFFISSGLLFTSAQFITSRIPSEHPPYVDTGSVARFLIGGGRGNGLGLGFGGVEGAGSTNGFSNLDGTAGLALFERGETGLDPAEGSFTGPKKGDAAWGRLHPFGHSDPCW